MTQKKMVLFAGLPCTDIARCKVIITEAVHIVAADKGALLGTARRNPDVIVINIDKFGGVAVIEQIKGNGYKGTIISVTNDRKLFRSPSAMFITFREIPDAVNQALVAA